MNNMRIPLSTVLLVCLSCCCFLTILLAFSPLTADGCVCEAENGPRGTKTLKKIFKSKKREPDHKLAIIVPFRDRFDELLIFAPHINKFLLDQEVNHDIFIINQVDNYRFNRASLINIGFLETKNSHDYIAMHDVDLLPLNPDLKYEFPKAGPIHIASPEYHPRYNYPTFVGGILLLRNEHFEDVNGMSNRYWGWGLEDDEFYVRLKEARLNVTRPSNIKTDKTNTLRHVHDKTHRKRDTAKCYNQSVVTRKRDRKTGLEDVKYEVISRHQLTIDAVPVNVINVRLECDRKETPWCDCTPQKL